MRSLLLALVVLLSPCATHASPPAEKKEPYPHIVKARETFPEVKRRFLQGLPKGSELRISTTDFHLLIVDKIEGDSITAHWHPGIARAYSAEPQPDIFTVSEADITDWAILRPDGVTEGGFAPGDFLGDRVQLMPWGTGSSCSEAERAVSSPPWDEIKRDCEKHGARLCRTDWGIFFKCQWDEQSQMYRVMALGHYACCA